LSQCIVKKLIAFFHHKEDNEIELFFRNQIIELSFIFILIGDKSNDFGSIITFYPYPLSPRYPRYSGYVKESRTTKPLISKERLYDVFRPVCVKDCGLHSQKY